MWFYSLFVFIETALYLWFISYDVFIFRDSTLIKFAGIIIVFAVSFFAHKTVRQKLTIGALFFTLMADLFLLYLNSYYEIGVSLFIVAQILHLVRINYGNRKLYVSVIIRILLSLSCVILLVVLKMVSLLNILVAVYFPQLVMNFIDSLINSDWKAGGILYSIGLLFFIGCDVCVGISNLITSRPASLLIWIFYLPSQVLICLSAAFDKGDSKWLKKNISE